MIQIGPLLSSWTTFNENRKSLDLLVSARVLKREKGKAKLLVNKHTCCLVINDHKTSSANPS